MDARAAAWSLVAALGAACGAEPPPLEMARGDDLALAPFTVLGRLAAPGELALRVDESGSPLPPGEFAAAVGRAAAAWQAAGPVRFRDATTLDEPAILFAWRRGLHGDCASFGVGPERAHAGPVAARSFVHFDAERDWDEPAVHRAALHELGHVLGLGHGDGRGSILQPDPPADIAALSDADRWGLHSLYGGGEDEDGDLAIVRGDLEVAPTLRQVAPPGRSELALFDTDGDGDDELCVWRTDRAGQGTLMIYHFGPGPRLERTVGPFYGAASAKARSGFVLAANGERLFVSAFEDGRLVARAFDERGGFRAAASPEHAPAAPRWRGDLDGDGMLEELRPVDSGSQ